MSKLTNKSDLVENMVRVDFKSLSYVVQWSPASANADAAAMASIYNSWVMHGGRVPSRQLTNESRMLMLVADLTSRGYPVWCFWVDDHMVGWSSLSPFSWGGIGTIGTMEFSVYLLPEWIGSGIGAQAAFLAYRQRHIIGFKSIVVWILATNKISRNLARGVGMQLWGTLPRQVETECLLFHNVEIWGCHIDDPSFLRRMDRIESRLLCRSNKWILKRKSNNNLMP